MTLKLYPELEQGSDAWLAARCGLITASTIGRLLTPTLKVADNDTSRALITTLAAERITGRPETGPVTSDMIRGTEAEPFARDAYSEHHAPVTQLGLMIRDFGEFKIGLSPDGLVGDNGLIEIKAPRAKGHINTILADQVPSNYRAQCQAALLVSGREWVDYISFNGGMALYVKRVHPDPQWTDALYRAAWVAEGRINDIVNAYQNATAGLPTTEPIPDPYAEPELKL